MNSKQTLWVSIAAAMGASLCCVAPLVLVSVGIGGAWIATLTRFEPLRPFLIGITLTLLALAWHKLYRQPAACAPDKRCADPAVLRRQRLVFCVVATVVLLLLAFPWFAPLFY